MNASRMILGLVAAATMLICSTALQAVVVSQWSFEGDLTDSVGGRDGSALGTVSFSPNGSPGGGSQSIDLTLGGNAVTYDVPAGDTLSGSYSVSLWVNSAVGDGGPIATFFGTRGPSDTSFDAKFQGNTQIHGDIGRGTGWITTGADANGVDYLANKWHHVSYAVTPTGYTIYMNGQQVGSGAYGADTPLLWDDSHDIAIGAVNTGGGENFTGRIDEVKVYNTTLSASEVRASMAPADYKPIGGLFNTGVDNSGNPLPNSSSSHDSHYSLTVNPDGAAPLAPFVEDQSVFPIVGGPWLANNTTSQWISPQFNTVGSAGGAGAAGNYEYELQFSMSGLDASTAFIAGNWATDNEAVDILLNGHSVGAGQLSVFAGNDSFAHWTPFVIDDGFLPGLNSLVFQLNNSAVGYTGLRVELSGFAAPGAPEPVTAMLGLLGMGALGLRLRRRRA